MSAAETQEERDERIAQERAFLVEREAKEAARESGRRSVRIEKDEKADCVRGIGIGSAMIRLSKLGDAVLRGWDGLDEKKREEWSVLDSAMRVMEVIDNLPLEHRECTRDSVRRRLKDTANITKAADAIRSAKWQAAAEHAYRLLGRLLRRRLITLVEKGNADQ